MKVTELAIAYNATLKRFTIGAVPEISAGADTVIFIGAEADASANTIDFPVEHAARLADWLTRNLPMPGLDDIQKFVADPHVPNAHGDLVTVCQSDVFAGAGQPQVVVSFGDGFAWHRSRDGKGGIVQTRYLTHIEADVTLAYTDRYGCAHTQTVPVWALRPWTDPNPRVAAQAAA